MKQRVFVILATLIMAATFCAASSNPAQPANSGPQLAFVPGDGNPPPTCIPGKPCDDKDYAQPKLVAGDGNPPPTCIPGKPCDDKDYLQPKLVAGDGNPPPTCIPGKPCDDKDYAAAEAGGRRWQPASDLHSRQAL